jgi:hypothetical protein
MLFSCESEKREKVYEPSEWRMTYDEYDYLMKYVYVDKNKCLHVSRECEVLDSVYQVEFVDTANLMREHFEGFCSECVNMPRYEHIDRILMSNTLKVHKEDEIIEWTPDDN